ncbi:C-terminal binding protein [Natronoarchaeum sp. GCM10025703]|uniref:C-terminal binding protein n=1 Tax=unclassified Natronoarchaeum TaxID=2620183 RepID=UPI0036170D4D
MTKSIAVSNTPFIKEDVISEQLSSIDHELVPIETGDADAIVEADPNAVILDVNTAVGADLIDQLDSLEIVARAGTGFDNVDVEACEAAGIPVVNVPGYSTNEVSTHAFSLLLACRRTLVEYDREVKDEEWNWMPDRPFPRFYGSTLGIVSFGTIARRIAELTEGFDLDLVVYDPYVDQEVADEYDADIVEFDELLERSDAVTIHAPLTEETHHMFDADAFDTLADHAIVVNVGRGGIIDEEALYEALVDRDIFGAGLDVLEKEPPTGSPLLERDDVVLTPHAAWYSADSHQDLNEIVSGDVLRALQGEEPENTVEPKGW